VRRDSCFQLIKWLSWVSNRMCTARGGSLEHQSVNINDNLGVDSGNVDVCVPKTKC
jgi:hypothetical protein